MSTLLKCKQLNRGTRGGRPPRGRHKAHLQHSVPLLLVLAPAPSYGRRARRLQPEGFGHLRSRFISQFQPSPSEAVGTWAEIVYMCVRAFILPVPQFSKLRNGNKPLSCGKLKWENGHKGPCIQQAPYKCFLVKPGYRCPPPPPLAIPWENVPDELGEPGGVGWSSQGRWVITSQTLLPTVSPGTAVLAQAGAEWQRPWLFNLVWKHMKNPILTR